MRKFNWKDAHNPYSEFLYVGYGGNYLGQRKVSREFYKIIELCKKHKIKYEIEYIYENDRNVQDLNTLLPSLYFHFWIYVHNLEVPFIKTEFYKDYQNIRK